MQIRKIVKLFWSIIDPLSICSKAVYQKALSFWQQTVPTFISRTKVLLFT